MSESNATVIRKCEETTIDGKPLVKLKIGGVWGYYYEDGDDLVEYDAENINKITFSYSEKKDNTETVHRKETKKLLKMISGNRIMGFHEYLDNKDQPKNAIVVWVYTKGQWRLSLKKGISDLIPDDISIMKNGITEMGW